MVMPSGTPLAVLVLTVIACLLAGTFSAISNKVLYDFKWYGRCGYHSFEKPYFLTFCMFIGEAMCIVAFWIVQWWSVEANRQRWYSWFPFCRPNSYTQQTDATSAAAVLPNTGTSDNNSTSSAAAPVTRATSNESASLLTTPRPAAGSADPLFIRPTFSSPMSTDPHVEYNPDSIAPEITERTERKPSKLYFFGLSLLDLSASAIGGIGLIYIDASANQMLRGSMVVFTALFSRILLRSKLKQNQVWGIICVVLGLVFVGLSGLLRANNSKSESDSGSSGNVSLSRALLGFVLVLIGSAINSLQNVFEEMLVKQIGVDAVHPLELVGWEGIFGSLVSGLILLPVVQAIPGGNCGSVEDTRDTFILMGRSGMIAFLVVGYTISLAVLNATSCYIGKMISAIFRQFVQALRVVLVWLFSIFLYYLFTSKSLGEKWDQWSWIQLFGFCMLIAGTYIYGIEKKLIQENNVTTTQSDDVDDDDEDEEENSENTLIQRKPSGNPKLSKSSSSNGSKSSYNPYAALQHIDEDKANQHQDDKHTNGVTSNNTTTEASQTDEEQKADHSTQSNNV